MGHLYPQPTTQKRFWSVQWLLKWSLPSSLFVLLLSLLLVLLLLLLLLLLLSSLSIYIASWLTDQSIYTSQTHKTWLTSQLLTWPWWWILTFLANWLLKRNEVTEYNMPNTSEYLVIFWKCRSPICILDFNKKRFFVQNLSWSKGFVTKGLESSRYVTNLRK